MTRRKFEIVEMGSNAFQLQEKGLIIFVCRRKDASPNNWIAFDYTGAKVDSDRYRADLIERLEMVDPYAEFVRLTNLISNNEPIPMDLATMQIGNSGGGTVAHVLATLRPDIFPEEYLDVTGKNGISVREFLAMQKPNTRGLIRTITRDVDVDDFAGDTLHMNIMEVKFYGKEEGITRKSVSEMAHDYGLKVPDVISDEQMQTIAQTLSDWNNERMSDSNDYGDVFETTIKSLFVQDLNEPPAPKAIAHTVPASGAIVTIADILMNIELWSNRNMSSLFRIERSEPWGNELSDHQKVLAINEDVSIAGMTLNAMEWPQDTWIGDMRIERGEAFARYVKYVGDGQYELVLSRTMSRLFATIRRIG